MHTGGKGLGTAIAASVLTGILAWVAQPATIKAGTTEAGDIYRALRDFKLEGGQAQVGGLTLKRDRLEMNFTGTFYFEAPVAGSVRGAIFLGEGTFRAQVPPGDFEAENVRRMLDSDVVESNFRTAVLRFSDDTFQVIGQARKQGPATGPAQKLASEFNPRTLEETGANLASRVAISILNKESPGFFAVEFDKGKRDRFTAILDPQGRLPSSTFQVNGGEKGLIFSTHRRYGTEIWMAFYGQADYQRGQVEYSDGFDLVDIEHYEMEADLTNPRNALGISLRIDFQSSADRLRAVPLSLNEGLPRTDSIRLKKAMRVQSSGVEDAQMETVQEDWEGGLTLFLDRPLGRGEKMSVDLDLKGDYMIDSDSVRDCFYPRSNTQWYPRHGYLDRSSYDVTFRHPKKYKVAAGGVLLEEGPDPENDSYSISRWKMDDPVALFTFGVGRYEKHAEKLKTEKGKEMQVEFYSLPGYLKAIKEDFIVAEMMNSLNYFDTLFGDYPYPKFGAVYHPRGFGQGFASLLLLPATDSAGKYTYSFIAHETAHQWWGNIVAWRSYRDQWLSEGFAEYSGILYTGLRENAKAGKDLIDELRRSLKNPPQTLTGIGKGRLNDIGPLIMGHRLETRETLGAYSTLIYNKGALVLRMLHFLFTNPSSGDGQPFFDMMADFVRRHANSRATTESFLTVANEHFSKSFIARKYGLKDLNWFFRQWVYESHLPTYRAEYKIQKGSGGAVTVEGEILQENAPENWFMPLPLVFQFRGDQTAAGTVHALGPKTPFRVPLPMAPRKVELDPARWVLSEDTRTKKR